MLIKNSWVSVFIVFALVFYGHLYFFNFDQGVSSAPGWVKALKDLAAIAFSIFILWKYKINRPPLLVFWFVFILLVQILFGLYFSSSKVEYLIGTKNLILGILTGYCLFLILKSSLRNFVSQVLMVFGAVMFAQVVFSYLTLFNLENFELWDFANASGLIGNPNTFALILNLSIAVSFMLPIQTQKVFVPVGFLVMGAGVILSASLSGFLILLAIYVTIIFLKLSKTVLLRSLAVLPILFLIAGSLYIYNPEVFGFFPHRQLYYKIKSTFINQENIPTPGGHESISFSGRRDQYRDGLESLKPISNSIFGSMHDGRYRVFDGQYLQLAVNHGIPMLVLFIIISLLLLRGTYLLRDSNIGKTLFLWSLVIICTQIFSHIWDYFPANIFLWFTYFAGLSLKKSDIDTVSDSAV